MKTILISALVIALLAGCAGYVPGSQSYWDAQVREMCAKDGGVTIFEQIVVSAAQANRLPRVGNLFGVAPDSLAKPDEVAFIKTQKTLIREGNPSVARVQQEIIRRADGKIVGRIVGYFRGGGDIPSPAHPTSFVCPDYDSIYEGIHNLYRIEGN